MQPQTTTGRAGTLGVVLSGVSIQPRICPSDPWHGVTNPSLGSVVGLTVTNPQSHRSPRSVQSLSGEVEGKVEGKGTRDIMCA